MTNKLLSYSSVPRGMLGAYAPPFCVLFEKFSTIDINNTKAYICKLQKCAY